MKHTEALLKAEKFQQKMEKIAQNDYWRPQYHIAAPANWINDPNGFCFYKGEYHLFYQYHPYSSQWGPMHWGHVASKDLVDWEHRLLHLLMNMIKMVVFLVVQLKMMVNYIYYIQVM